jgi:hypothetical protein
MQAIKELRDTLDGKPKETHVVEEKQEGDRLSKITWEIVHVQETREQLDRENEPLQIEYNEVKIINGNGSGNGHG